MADHEPAVRSRNFSMFQVLCRCGWQSEWNASEDAARDEHVLHVELESLTADDFGNMNLGRNLE